MTIGLLEIKKDTPTEIQLLWEIPFFSSLVMEDEYKGPDFKFLNYEWYLGICPLHDDSSVVALVIGIMDYVGRSHSIMCTFGIVKNDKSLVQIKSFHQKYQRGDSQDIDTYNCISRELLLRRKAELIPLDKLTIMCTIKLLDDPETLTELNALSENFESLFASEEFCDIIFHVEKKEFKAHKAIIATRSPVFAAMFKHETTEEQTGIIIIPDCSPDSFQDFLRYLYCGKIGNISFQRALHLFKIAHKYDVKELEWFCMDYMGHEMNVENFFDAVALFEEFDHYRLSRLINDFFNRNHIRILKTTEWKNLLKSNVNLANDLLIEMSSNVELVRKYPRLEIK